MDKVETVESSFNWQFLWNLFAIFGFDSSEKFGEVNQSNELLLETSESQKAKRKFDKRFQRLGSIIANGKLQVYFLLTILIGYCFIYLFALFSNQTEQLPKGTNNTYGYIFDDQQYHLSNVELYLTCFLMIIVSCILAQLSPIIGISFGFSFIAFVQICFYSFQSYIRTDQIVDPFTTKRLIQFRMGCATLASLVWTIESTRMALNSLKNKSVSLSVILCWSLSQSSLSVETATFYLGHIETNFKVDVCQLIFTIFTILTPFLFGISNNDKSMNENVPLAEINIPQTKVEKKVVVEKDPNPIRRKTITFFVGCYVYLTCYFLSSNAPVYLAYVQKLATEENYYFAQHAFVHGIGQFLGALLFELIGCKLLRNGKRWVLVCGAVTIQICIYLSMWLMNWQLTLDGLIKNSDKNLELALILKLVHSMCVSGVNIQLFRYCIEFYPNDAKSNLPLKFGIINIIGLGFFILKENVSNDYLITITLIFAFICIFGFIYLMYYLYRNDSVHPTHDLLATILKDARQAET